MGFLSKTKQQKMDILQKVQENLALTQQNITLLANQNQDSLAANQETLQATLKSIETMLEKAPANTQEAKEHSPDEKKRAAYALNCCTISVSQIVDYDDIYILEQEYESILNNLNLENMPKDEALLDIYKQLLDTITFFRIQEGDKAMLEKEYQDKIKNAIWLAVPPISLAGLAKNPIGAAINLATQVGIGYMNYRREKAGLQSEQEKQKWQLTRSAMEQFNGLRRELFTTAWRLADEYEFADNLRITEQQIAIFNKILLEPDDLKRYERLNYIKGSFEAYTPFWYHLGNAAYKASQNMREEDAERFKEIARENYQKYIDDTEDKKMNLFRHDHIRAACALELFELTGEEKLLDTAKEAAGSNFDVLEICAMSYLQVGKTKKAKDMLRMLVNEDYNATVNGQILSSIYVSEYIKDSDGRAKHNYETLSDRINSAYLFPMPDTPSSEQAEILTAQFLKKQKVYLLENFKAILKELVGKYTIKFNQAIPAANPAEVDTQWYFSDSPDAIQRRRKEIERVFSQDNAGQYIRRFGFAVSDRLDILNELCVAMEAFPHVSGKEFVHNVQKKVEEHKTAFKDIINKVMNDQFSKDDVPLLFDPGFGDLTDKAFSDAIAEFYNKSVEFIKMVDISGAEALLRTFCIQQEVDVPILVLNGNNSVTTSRSKNRYISLYMLDMDKEELNEEIDRVCKMKEIIHSYIENHQLVKPKDKGGMIVLTDKEAKFEIYRRNYLSEKHLVQYYGDPLLVICHDNAKRSREDLVFTTKGIVYFERGNLFKYREAPWQLYPYPPVKYTNVKTVNDGIRIGTRVIEFTSETFNVEALHELKELLAKKTGKSESDSKAIVKSNLTDKIDEQINQLIHDLERTEMKKDFQPVDRSALTNKVDAPSVEQEDVSEENTNNMNESSVTGNSRGCCSIHLNKVINEKNSYGEWDIEGTVTSGTIEVGELCYVEDIKYRVNHITRLDNNQPASKALCGQTAKFSLYKMR